MANSVEVHSKDAATGESRTITLVKTGADTLSAHYASSADPGNVRTFDLHDVSADLAHGKLSVTVSLFLFSATATATVHSAPPSVSADAGTFGTFTYPLQPGDDQKLIAFLKAAHFQTCRSPESGRRQWAPSRGRGARA